MKRLNIYCRMALITILLLCSHSIHALGFPSEKSGFSDLGKRYAFCIGIQDYHDPKIIDLTRPRNDAKGLADVLKSHGGFDHVIVMTDDLDRKNALYPTKRNIRKALDRYVKIIRPGI